MNQMTDRSMDADDSYVLAVMSFAVSICYPVTTLTLLFYKHDTHSETFRMGISRPAQSPEVRH